MTWQTEDGKHEGWLAPTFPDGALGSGWSHEGITVARIGEQPLPYEQWQHRPEAEVTGWVVACECAWRGEPWVRVFDPGEEDLAARRVFSPDADADQLDDAARAEWRAHVAPHEALAEVTALADEHADVGRRLADAVARARAAGASWTDVGLAAGMTRQSAHERWRGVSVSTSDR